MSSPIPPSYSGNGGDSAATNRAASPIADLSYRSYDGPLYTRAARWWIVALAGIRQARTKPGFWILTVLAVLPYLIIGAVLYFNSALSLPSMLSNPAVGQKYATWFWRAFQYQAFFLFIIALMVGTGSISADNRANALLVYLSKPITKGDYLLGKWMGVFLIVFLVAFSPAFILYAYCLLSFKSEGFLSQEPLLLFRILLTAMVPAAVHASLVVGFSAWSKTPRMAGAIYFGFYFISNMFAGMIWAIKYNGDFTHGITLRHLSVDGAIQGLVQHILGITDRLPLASALGLTAVEPPDLTVVLVLAVALCALGVIAARVRIRAVEVVRG